MRSFSAGLSEYLHEGKCLRVVQNLCHQKMSLCILAFLISRVYGAALFLYLDIIGSSRFGI